MTSKKSDYWHKFSNWQKGGALLLVIGLLLFSRWNYVKQSRNSCHKQAKTEAHQIYVSNLIIEDSIEKAVENGTYAIPVYNHLYEKCLELKGL